VGLSRLCKRFEWLDVVFSMVSVSFHMTVCSLFVCCAGLSPYGAQHMSTGKPRRPTSLSPSVDMCWSQQHKRRPSFRHMPSLSNITFKCHLMVTNHGGHRRTFLPVQQINLRAYAGIILIQIIHVDWDVNWLFLSGCG